MKQHFPRTRRKFAHAWDEIQYLYDKLLYWFYGEHPRPDRARRYARRLSKLLQRCDTNEESILGQECRSLICELRGEQFFVLGDNRPCSVDSRSYGPVSREQIKSRVPCAESPVRAHLDGYTLPEAGKRMIRPL